jgi:hypothetical protein
MRLADAIVYLATDDKRLVSGLESAKNKTSAWASGLGGTVSKLMGGAALAGTTALAGSVAAIGVGAFNVSNDLRTATADMAASLGLPLEEAEKFGGAIKQIYGNNFGESITDVGVAVGEVTKQLELSASDPSLVNITEKALALRDSFDTGVNESVSAAKTLMENFGLTSDQAFDFIAAGYQKGLDRSGDFLDTVGEYSTQFSNGGASAEQFFSLMESGLQGGMLGTDKAADAFKEFRLRIQDGSDTTRKGLEMLGLNADQITRGLADGTMTVADAWTIVTDALRKTDDATVRMQAGAAVIGTQYEDLGDSFVDSVSLTKTALKDMEGATDKLQEKYKTFGNFFTGMWRRATVAISPLTDALLVVANGALPAIEEAFSSIEKKVSAAAEKAKAFYTVVSEGGGGKVAASVGAVGALTGAETNYNATTKVTTVDWGDFTYTYDALSKVTKVDWIGWAVGGLASWVYDAESKVTKVDWTTYSGGGVSWVYDADAGIQKIDWNAGEGKFRFKYDADAGIVDVDWGLGRYTANYNSGVTINNVLWGLYYGHYEANAGITDVVWGLYRNTYNADSAITSVLWGLYKNTYNADASVTDVAWGLFFGDYGAKAGVTDVLWGLFTNKYTAESSISNVLWGVWHGHYESTTGITDVAWGLFRHTYNADSSITSVLWGLYKNTYDTEANVSKVTWAGGIFDSVKDAFINMQSPAWISSLLAWVFPDTPATVGTLVAWTFPSPPTAVTSLLAWAFPDPPSDVSALVAWTFPEFSEGLLATWAQIFAWTFPDFSGELAAIWSRIFGWKFPDAPGWISTLLNWTPATPAWVSSLLSWAPSLPSLPSWLGGGGADTGEPKAKDGRSGARSGATVNVYVQNVNNNMDVEQIAYKIQQRLAGV